MAKKFIDMFAGMGTVRMGFEQAGWKCVSSIEFDKHKRRIYEVIFGNEPEFGDITAVRGSDLPYADCWCFGAPCQDFSIAGIRAGLDGDRSSLVREVFRLIRETSEEHRPEWLLYENVKGMLSSNKGLDYLEILFEMATLGYDIQYELLNSKDFGVPQNRERVYTLGHLRRCGSRKVFPISGQSNEYSTIGQSAETAVARCLTGGGHSGGNHSGMTILQVKQIGNVMPTKTRDNPNQGRVYDPAGLAPCLNKMEGGGREPLIASGIYTNVSPEYNRGPLPGLSRTLKADGNHPAGVMITQKKITRETDIAGTLTARNPSTSRGNNQAITGVLSYDLKATPNSTRRGAVKVEYVGALDTQCNVGITAQTRIRRLTPRECMRLQGVDDAVTDKLISGGISDTQMYRAAGDACTVNVIYEIAKRL